MADDINKTKKEVEDLIKKLTSQADVTYYQNLFEGLNKNKGNIEQFQKLMSQVKDDIDETRGALNYVSESFKNIVEDLKGAKGPLNSQIASLNKISNIARQALEVRRGENTLSKQQLQNLQVRNKREIDNLVRLEKAGGFQGKALQNLQDQIKAAKEVDAAFEEIKKTEEDVNKQLGFGPKLLGGIDKALQKLGLPNLGFDDALKKTKEMAQEAKANGEEFNSTKAYVGNIKDNLAESLTSANLLQAAGVALVASMKQVDTMTGDTAKNFGMSYTEALALNNQLTSMAVTSNNAFVTTKGLNESYTQINQSLGTNGKLSKDILISQTELVKQAGYSVEAATMLSKLSLATGKPTKEIAASFLGQAKALNLVNGTAINEKQLLEDVSSLSKDTLATFADQPGKLAEAAYEARKLGLDLEKLKGTQSALLDIESSIANEFEAEVLTGKQLNLEKARYFALTNDYAGLAKELGKQDITRDSFSKMNVLQQEATAKALGMTAETMGGMLMDQEAMNKLSGVEGKTAKEKFDNLVKEVGLEEAKKQLGDETLANQLASASTQDRLVAITEKLKEVFVSIAEVVMQIVSPIVDVLSPVLSFIGQTVGLIVEGFKVLLPVITAVVGVTAILFAKTIALAIASAAKGVWTALGGIPFIGPGLAIAGTLAAAGAIKSIATPAGDINSPADGKTQVSTKEGGLFELSKNDDMVAFPGASKALSNPNTIKSPPQTVVQQSPSIDYDKMASAMSRVQVQTNLDGVNVSRKLQTPMGIATRKL